MKTTLSPIQQERLNDLKLLSNHGGRDQWHGLRCHHINNGQFTATYSDLAQRWGVKISAVYSTIKRFIKLGLITTERFERATLFTLTEPKKATEVKETPKVKILKDPKKPKDTKRIKDSHHPKLRIKQKFVKWRPAQYIHRRR